MSRVAVIGAGISGLAAAYLLSRRFTVHLFEREPRLGGHTHTIMVRDGGRDLPLDTGFLVFNERTYPNLIRLFAEVGVASQASDMSFSVSSRTEDFEYSSRGLRGFFAQPSNLRPAHVRLLREIMRFNREAPRLLVEPGAERVTLGDYLDAHGFGEVFAERYLFPMASAIWSASVDGIRGFPALTLVRFFQNHGMLSVGRHPVWRVVTGGSHSYVPKLTAPLAGRITRDASIRSVLRDGQGVTLTFHDRPDERFDHVVFACHGDQVLPLLAAPTDRERDVFQHFRTTRNETVLHTDASFLPSRPWARASWNYELGAAPGAPPAVTYHLNRLQGIESGRDYCVTLNPRRPIDEAAVIRRMTYAHPQYTREAIRAQGRWGEVSGALRTHYCGAYWFYGFHEDGLRSAVRVAGALGVPW